MSGRLLVIGDALLDRDWLGSAERLCPDSVGPVFDHERELIRPGGAALAAALAARAGCRVTFLTAIGDDDAGAVLRAGLEAAGVEVVALRLIGPTPEKIRLRVDRQTVARIDRGCGPRAPVDGDRDLARVLAAGSDAVLASDYGRGLLDDAALRAALGTVARRLPVVWDPHPLGAGPTGSVAAVTPSRHDARRVLGADRSPSDAAVHLADRWGAPVVLTCGPDGAVVAAPGRQPRRFATTRADGDPCGAGDRFAASLAASLGAGDALDHAVPAALAAASALVAAGGAALADPSVGPSVAERVRAGGGTVVAAGGCFDVLHVGHVRLLERARAVGDCLVVCLNSDASVRRLKGERRPVNPEDDRRAVLLGLGCVDDVVVFDEDDPCDALRRLRPDVFVKGEDYSGRVLPEAAVVSAWGGRIELVPLVEGRSTTRILRLASSVPRAG